MNDNPLLAHEEALRRLSDEESRKFQEILEDHRTSRSFIAPAGVVVTLNEAEDEYLYPRVRRVVLDHAELRQLIESRLGYPLPNDTNFYALRNCYGDERVHLFMESREFPPTEEATLTMQGVPVLPERQKR